MNSSPIINTTEVHETACPEDANQKIREGWKLLGVFQEAEESNGRQAAWALYVLGKPDPAAAARVSEVRETWEEDANDLLADGWELLLTFKRKGDYDELPRFIVGRMTAPEKPKPKFTGNGIH